MQHSWIGGCHTSRWGWWTKGKKLKRTTRGERARIGPVRQATPRLSRKDGERTHKGAGRMPGLLRSERESWPQSRPVQEEPREVWLQWWESGASGVGLGMSQDSSLVLRKLVCIQDRVYLLGLSPTPSGVSRVICIRCIFREKLQQLVEMQRDTEKQRHWGLWRAI